MNKVGIYSAIYNNEKYLEQMINSIKNQSYKNWELSMVDDGSTDNSYNVACELAKNDNRIKISKINHCGIVGKVKNKAISYFSNDVIYCCGVDSDDYIATNAIEIFTKFLDNNISYGAACGNFICFDENKTWSFNHVANSGDFQSETLLKYMNFFPLRFYRKVIYDIVGGYSEELTNADDFDLALKLDENTKIKRIKHPITYFYRQHSSQISSTIKNEENDNAKIALQNAINRRGIKGKVINNIPPFIIKKDNNETHFIWGK